MSSEPKCDLADLKPVKFSGSHSLALGTLPQVQYGLFSEKLRQNASKGFHCSVFCSGRKCRYEGTAFWNKDDMPVMGTFSTWITDDIVTMSRPSTETIDKYKIIKQFREFGIKSLINLQQRGEHSSCGVRLEPSGFTYDPQVFMENKSKLIKYYFKHCLCRRKDFGSVPKTTLLDMVKVLSFALSEGKVAIHSHAGLGRAGVLVACYLVYSLRCKPTDAVEYVRNKRPGAIQTKSHVESVQAFAQFVVPMFIVFANVIPRDNYKMSLNAYLKRQRYLLHGFEGRLLKHVPKPVFLFCERLLSLMDEDRFCRPLDPDDLYSPDKFLQFLSSRCRLQLRLQFSRSKFSDSNEWAIKVANGGVRREHDVGGETRHCAPPSPPNGMDEGRAFWDSPDSMSSQEERSQHQALLNHIGGFRSHFETEDDGGRLSEDEETGKEPEMEYSDEKGSSKDASAAKKYREGEENVKEEEDNKEENDAVDTDHANANPPEDADNINDDFDVEANDDDEDNDEDDEENEAEDDDPLEDLNSEECNAIIDSVLQETCPSEQNTPMINGLQKKRDIFANKDTKGCSTLSMEEEPAKKPLTNTAVINALLADHYTMDTEFTNKLRKYQRMLNNRSSAWEKIAKEMDPLLLSALLWSWLEQLREPVLSKNDLSIIVIRSEKTMEILQKLDNGTRYTTEYLVRFIARLHPKSSIIRTDLIRRLLASLTHQALGIQGTLRPMGRDWGKLRQGTARELTVFIDRLYEMCAGDYAAEKPLFS
ncbi:hypothetical protein JTE90_015597 [Oedothorax gibbosus]|uniref:Tyrosine specific protein phosphatases domain-containing protein n=1 Tax=Oedothorax gibbosus TaxID=931172 RepID=A0AAV6UV91_9ARAC|nr:hypothetical protein JTE90_015597 [Oedothorax gibbosus]